MEDPQSSLHFHGFESIASCVGGEYGYPELTPGNVAALLLDLVDPPSPSDSNAQYLYSDAVGGLLEDVLLAATEETTTTAQEFLVALYTRAANQTHDIWATAMGDGFVSDTTPPGPVTNLTSSSHAVGSSSPDNTVDWAGQWGSIFVIYGPFSIIALYEWHIEPGERNISLENISGSVDWGISILPMGQVYMSKTEIYPDGISWQVGPGGNESLIVDFDQAGYFCLAVGKTSSSDLGLTGEYQIRLGSGLSSIQSVGLPSVTRLTGAAPNPFNPLTTIHYSLAQPGNVSLVVYDLSDARIRELVGGNQEAGERQVVWTGTDSSGRSVSSGVYMVRMMVDGEFGGLKKLLLMK